MKIKFKTFVRDSVVEIEDTFDFQWPSSIEDKIERIKSFAKEYKQYLKIVRTILSNNEE